MFKRIGVAALVSAALVSGQAMAVTGGGATIPARLYKGAADSILPASFSYAATGSGIGKSAFLTNNAAQFGTTGTVHFAASESILTTSEISTYNTNFASSFGPLIQIPSVITSVAIAYKKAGQTTLNLSSAQLCDALSGSATTWGALLGTNDTTAIRVVYQNGSSGSTEVLTRHLNAVCPVKFSIHSSFTRALNNGGSWLPSNWVGVAADGDVMAAVTSVEGSIGYLGPDGVEVKNNAVVSRVNGVLPTLVDMTLALVPILYPTTRPYDPSSWTPVIARPTSGYAISATSNLIFSQCYKDPAVANEIRNFLTTHYAYPGNTPSNRAHGFVGMPEKIKNAVIANFVTNTSGNNLDINNPSICNGIGRPL
ncbi:MULTISPECIES: substrate-binding domain-containing protein [Pseudomonas]|uniref:Substrate-binding domain-containing protein n=1 Tax=Pseudomonas aphyarum TaxID=2942629 RepID=A0ABT5PKF9_9PSED|nr:substrate-binding domain-containing protein [Pseudomonas aphyarum]MDD0968486.1 substrate-binding domain-containing protein [Pseudomonas aphyarum]MDD1124386.1 substrate-binding domain-containing protein [Pseudomonas aphyarum]